ncbi:MAG TPA: hypothetical protein VNK82_08415 [Terriglobales bacterium]|nr:hypothetical protein [Terriglobales bacterium]
MLHADGSQTGQKLLLDGSYQIVKQTLSSGGEYTFQYDKNGNLTEARSATSATRFEYDGLNRLTGVVTAEGQRLTYSYAPGERSLVARYDHGASLSAGERRDSGLTFASYWEVAATRSLASDFGAVRYSEALGRFQLSGTEGEEVVTPESRVLTALEKLRLYDYGVPLDERIGEFQKPSNLMFLPPEYASVNCCPLCLPGEECPPCDPGTYGPVIYSITPSQGASGQIVTVIISGEGFEQGASVTAGSGITVTGVLMTSDTQLQATFSINQNAPLGNHSVRVDGSNAKNFKVTPGVTITSADITQDLITLELVGPGTGSLRLEVKGANGQPPIQVINTGTSSLAAGTYNYTFDLNTIPIGEYFTTTATWTVNSIAGVSTQATHFKVLGSYRQSQYNTPAENRCTGNPTPVTVYNNNCSATAATMIDGFVFRVTNPQGGTGSGHSISFGDVKQEFFCSNRGDFRSFQTITGTLGPVNNSTVAVCGTSELYQANMRVFIRGVGVKSVTDRCPACCIDVTHLDNYTTDTRCSGIQDLTAAPALTIRLY